MTKGIKKVGAGLVGKHIKGDVIDTAVKSIRPYYKEPSYDGVKNIK